MNFSIPVGEHGPTIIALLVCAFAWGIILAEKRRRRRGAAAALAEQTQSPVAPASVRQSLPLSREVFDYFRATGPGWQARIDEVLRHYVREEEKRSRRRVAEEREVWRGEGE